MITKRQLGLIFMISGLLGIVGLLAIDLFRVGNYGGIGPMQRLALTAAGLIVLVGLTLLPAGNRPA
ncbi:MAG: hypothetical protein KJ063_02780 [Anaerolineae bacterium]|nr:hypothetical protein [Anaerolineae bacterium]